MLLIPFVYALLGDNPMQSELSSHIGLRGKHFCRICYVKGSDAEEGRRKPTKRNQAGENNEQMEIGHSDAESVASAVSDGSNASGVDLLSSKGVKKTEGFHQMLQRVTRFMKVRYNQFLF